MKCRTYQLHASLFLNDAKSTRYQNTVVIYNITGAKVEHHFYTWQMCAVNIVFVISV